MARAVGAAVQVPELPWCGLTRPPRRPGGRVESGRQGLPDGVQVSDDLGDDVKIPGRKFGVKKLIAAQAAGDFEALKERGRRIVRVAL